MTNKISFKKDSIYFQYDVSDIERAKKFYNETFGFEIAWEGGTEVGWCELALPVNGAKLGLNLKREGDITPGSGTLTFDVTNLDATKSYLESKDVKTTEITDIPEMVSYFDCYDSEGNRIQIVSEPRVKS
ncbi:MAG: VOC family protein [Candidatus Heimdallarchaeota archaeon]|nr:MAG: VOC family protein [Candidatus Heimdallarchaeota archaeon]